MAPTYPAIALPAPEAAYAGAMPSSVRIEHLSNPAEFLRRSEPFRADHPIETNVIGSVAASVVDGSRRYDRAHWYLALGPKGEVLGLAVHTPHYRPILSPMAPEVAAQLAGALLEHEPALAGVTGPLEPARAFAAVVHERTGRDAARQTLQELIYVLGEHTPRPGVVGAARAATDDDVPLLVEWFSEFGEEALGSIHRVTPEDVRLRLGGRTMLLWEADGVPVAMAGHAAIMPSPGGDIGRIGPVYTARAARGHGFGAAVTSAMVEHLQALGCTTVALYTDADYPRSNAVYQRLGFQVVGSVVELGDPAD